MKIVLISIISSNKYGNTGVDFIGAYLRKNPRDTVEVKYYHHNENADAIFNDLPKDYDIYGFSVFETNYGIATKTASAIKALNPKAVTVFGGQFASMNYTQIINDCKYVDYIVIGEGESPMMRLVEHYRNSADILTGDKNIAAKHDKAEKIYNTEDDVNREACFNYFINDSIENNMQKTHCIMTKSNICNGNCSFCCSRKGRAVYKKAEKIANEISFLAENHGVRKFFITDDDIFDTDCNENRARLHGLFQMIDTLKMNLIFSCFAKPKTVCNPQNKALISEMSRLGFSHIFLGIDAGSNFDRRLYNKNSSREECLNALKILRDAGISPRYGLMFFNPYSTPETMKETYRFLVGLKSANYYHYGGLRVQLLNGTRLLKKVRDDGLLSEKYSFMNTESYNFLHHKTKEAADFMKFEFLPAAERVRNQYNTLSRLYSTIRHISNEAERYRQITEYYGDIEFEVLREYFYHLYEEGNVDYCRNHLENFILLMEQRTYIYAEAIEKLRQIFKCTPIRKAEENVFA